jgi:hypothetical protein
VNASPSFSLKKPSARWAIAIIVAAWFFAIPVRTLGEKWLSARELAKNYHICNGGRITTLPSGNTGSATYSFQLKGRIYTGSDHVAPGTDSRYPLMVFYSAADPSRNALNPTRISNEMFAGTCISLVAGSLFATGILFWRRPPPALNGTLSSGTLGV